MLIRPATVGLIGVSGRVRRDPYSYVNAETRSVVDAMDVAPSVARKALIDTLISGLKTDGLFSGMDFLHIEASHNSQAGLLNYKDPNTFKLVESGTGTWTTDRGWAGNGVDGRLTTGAAPASLPNFLQDSGTIFMWSRTAAAMASPSMGLAANATLQLHPRFTSDTYVYRVNQSTNVTTANTDGSGFYSASRTGSGVTQGYKNGVALGTAGAIASTGRSANSIVLGGNQTAYVTTQIAISGAMRGTDATDNANLYARLNTFMSAIGAA